MARSDLVLKPPVGWSGAPGPACFEQFADLISVEHLAPDIRRFTFRPEQSAEFLPGQYLIVHLDVGLRRAYSMCNLPDGETMQIISKRYVGGAGSNALATLEPGARVTVEGPFGVCTLRKRPGRTIFVAGGTGISPILSLVRQAAAEGLDFEATVDVIYGVRTPRDLAAGDDLDAAVAGVKGATYRPVVEEPGEGWAGQIGRAPGVIAELDFDPAATTFYVAGPPVMVNAVKVQLKEMGVPITRVYYDSFG
jgi:toluene monooxygenase electron transfer component